jgi:hypothetical protein
MTLVLSRARFLPDELQGHLKRVDVNLVRASF